MDSLEEIRSKAKAFGISIGKALKDNDTPEWIRQRREWNVFVEGIEDGNRVDAYDSLREGIIEGKES